MSCMSDALQYADAVDSVHASWNIIAYLPSRLGMTHTLVPDVQVGQKRPRQVHLQDDYGMSHDLQHDKDGNPRKKLRSGFPSSQFLTIYDHRDTQKQRCEFTASG